MKTIIISLLGLGIYAMLNGMEPDPNSKTPPGSPVSTRFNYLTHNPQNKCTFTIFNDVATELKIRTFTTKLIEFTIAQGTALSFTADPKLSYFFHIYDNPYSQDSEFVIGSRCSFFKKNPNIIEHIWVHGDRVCCYYHFLNDQKKSVLIQLRDILNVAAQKRAQANL